MRTLFSLLFLALTMATWGQEIPECVGVITTYRGQLADQLEQKQIDAIEVKRLAKENCDDRSFLSIEEEELLLLLTGQFDVFLTDMQVRNGVRYHSSTAGEYTDYFDYLGSANSFVQQLDDYLAQILFDNFEDRYKTIIEDAGKAGLKPVDADFVRLFVEFTHFTGDFCNGEQEEKIAALALEHETKFPSSPFLPYIREFITVEYKPGRLGGGVFLNLATLQYNKSLNEYLANPAFVQFEVHGKWHPLEISASVGLDVSNPSIKQSLRTDTIDFPYPNYSAFVSSLRLGCRVYENRIFGVTPYVGLRNFVFRPERSNGTDSGIRYTDFAPLQAGLDLSYFIRNKRCKGNYPGESRNKRPQGEIRLRLSYQEPFNEDLSQFSDGGLWTISVGGGINFYQVKKFRR